MSEEVRQVFLNCSVTRGTVKFEGMYYAPGLDAHPTGFEQLINNTILQFLSSRESSKTCPKTGGDFGQFGDAAKLREALKATLDLFWDIHNANRSPQSNQAYAVIRQIKAALAAPPRNCDIYLTEEAVDAATVTVRDCEACSRIDMEAPCVFCMVRWLLAPATEKEGGAK